MDRFFWTREDKDKLLDRSFFPGGEFKLRKRKACLLDWAVIGVILLGILCLPRYRTAMLACAIVGFLLGSTYKVKT